MLTYGIDHTCLLCGGRDSYHRIRETLTTKMKAKEILHHLMIVVNDKNNQLSTSEREERFMFGVLIASGRKLVSVSGRRVPASFQLALSKLSRFELCQTVVHPLMSRGGSTIQAGMVQTCQVTTNVPLLCAAPKIIDRANRLGLSFPYSMSEIWFDPKAYNRLVTVTTTRPENANRPFTEHGKSRTSCPTCQRILPMMLCPLRNASRTENELTIPVPRS